MNDESAEGPRAPSVQHIKNCAYSSWHDKYKKLCPRSKVISNLPREFIDYLLEDGIALPNDGYEWDNKSDNGSDFGDQEDEVDDPTNRFPELHQKILDIIQSLGGSVTPKTQLVRSA